MIQQLSGQATEQQRLAQHHSDQELETLSNWRKAVPGDWEPLEALKPEPQLALVLLDELGAGTDPVEGPRWHVQLLSACLSAMFWV